MRSGPFMTSLLAGILLALLIIAAAGLGWPMIQCLWVGALLLTTFLLFFAVRWHAGSFGYECPLCGHKFAISTLTDFVSSHYPDKKSLKCPACHERSWCQEIPGSAVPAKAESNRQDK